MRIKKLILLLLFSFTLLFSCKKDMISNPVSQTNEGFNIPAPSPVTGQITGIVVNEHNIPVEAASVQLGSSTVVTDVKGYFYFSNASLDKYVTTITVNKPGYFKALRSFSATGSRNYVSVKLIPKTLAGTIESEQGGTITLSNGTAITLPSGGVIVKATGALYTGTINVYASYIDPTVADFAASVPGSMMAKDDQHMFLLQSTGMIAVEIESAGAQPLQLTTGKKANIHLFIPSSLTAGAPSDIDTWSLNDNGIWQKESMATRNGSFYDLEVSHFSFWNTDVPVNAAYLTMHVKDTAGNPLSNLTIQLHVPNNTTWWATTYGITDSVGTVAGLVPAGLPLEMSAIPNIYNCPVPVAMQNVGPFNSDTTLNVTVALANTQEISISGTVTDCNNQPLANGYAVINAGPFNQYNVPVINGVYTLTAAYCSGSGTVNVAVYDGAAFTTSADIPVTGNVVTIPSLHVCGLDQVSSYDSDGLTSFGSFIAGQPLNGSNYLEAVVVVHTAGTYNILLQTNGMTFNGNGYFPRVGRDTVFLLGTGVPQAIGFTLVTFYGTPGPGIGLELFVYANTTDAASYSLGARVTVQMNLSRDYILQERRLTWAIPLPCLLM